MGFMNERINTGIEHGVKWEIDMSKFDPIVISVKNIKTGKKENKVYNCIYKPICGYDILDIQNIEKILDDLIIKYANDNYGK